MVVKAICYIQANDAGFQGVVGFNKAANKYKAYAGICPQPEDSPFTVTRLASKPGVMCKDGRSGTFNGTVNIHCYHKNYDQVVEVCDAVIEALDGKKGDFNGYQVQALAYEDMFDGAYDKEHEVHQRVIVFRVIGYENPNPT